MVTSGFKPQEVVGRNFPEYDAQRGSGRWWRRDRLILFQQQMYYELLM
jgi:hypothetical protein